LPFNDPLPQITVDPDTDTADGEALRCEPLRCEPLAVLLMARRYFLF
jgi:urease alpha subunit